MSELVDLQKYEEEKERIIKQFGERIAELEGAIQTTQEEIPSIQNQISVWAQKVEDLEPQIPIWRNRKDTADSLYTALERNYKHEIDAACDAFNIPWSGYATVERVSVWYPIIGWMLDYVKIYMPIGTLLHEKANKTDVRNLLINHAKEELFSCETKLASARSSLISWQNELEAKTRHMRDLQLALEGTEEEERGALALWGAEFESAAERKRIEIDSIGRDLCLGYPELPAEKARLFAEQSYGDALAQGFTRLADAIRIATDIAKDWWQRQVTPGLTTSKIRCPSCNVQLELTISDIAEHNRPLNCPQCVAFVSQGFSLRWIYERIPVTPPIPVPLIAGAWDFLKKYAPWIGVAGLGAVTIYAATTRKK